MKLECASGTSVVGVKFLTHNVIWSIFLMNDLSPHVSDLTGVQRVTLHAVRPHDTHHYSTAD